MASRYKKIRLDKNTIIDRHRYMMEQHLGRKLKPHEIIHHINGKSRDDRIENLKLTTRSKHTQEHVKRGNHPTFIPRKMVGNNLYRCSRCKQDKPKSEFHKDKYTYSKIVSQCKTCKREQRKERYRIYGT